MAQQELIRCIHTDKKTGKTTVKFLAPSVVARTGFMKNYGYRVEHIAKAKEAPVSYPQTEEIPVTDPVAGDIPELHEPVFVDTPEPVIVEETPVIPEISRTLSEVSEPAKPKRKYATGQPKRVTNK